MYLHMFCAQWKKSTLLKKLDFFVHSKASRRKRERERETYMLVQMRNTYLPKKRGYTFGMVAKIG